MDILICGSIAYDYLMRYPQRFRDSLIEQKLDKITLSFLVEDMVRHDGGVAANIAYTMGLLGGKPRLMSAVGQDFIDYRARLEAVGVDCSCVVVDETRFTASFFCNTDAENNQISSFYAGAMTQAQFTRIDAVTSQDPELVVISPESTETMLNRVEECIERGLRYVYDPSWQVGLLSGEQMRYAIQHAYMMMCNEYEWEILSKKTEYTVDDVREIGCVFINTMGADGANIYALDRTVHVPTFTPRQILNPTGAGDAFRAGFLRGLELGLPWEVTGRMGTLCGSWVLEYDGTQQHNFTPAEFVARLREEFDDQGALDALL